MTHTIFQFLEVHCPVPPVGCGGVSLVLLETGGKSDLSGLRILHGGGDTFLDLKDEWDLKGLRRAGHPTREDSKLRDQRE